MAQLGRRNTLPVLHSSPPGIYLDGGPLGEILLPRRYIPAGTGQGDLLDVFVYRDSEDRLVATTDTPLAMVGEFAVLEVAAINRQVGAFLNWGLPKDLLLPFREQTDRLWVGDKVLVYVKVDERTDRIIATTRLQKHASKERPPFKTGQAVRLMIAQKTPLGYNAIVEGTHMGLLHQGGVATPLQPGQELGGYIAQIHPGGKLDLCLDASGYQRVASLTDRILAALQAAGGRLRFDDESSPEELRAAFDTSKKAFKQALGALYKQRKIEFTRPGIRWLDIREEKAGDWKPGARGGPEGRKP